MSKVWRELAIDRPQEEQLIIIAEKPNLIPRIVRFRANEWPHNNSYSYLWYPIPGFSDESPSSDPAEVLVKAIQRSQDMQYEADCDPVEMLVKVNNVLTTALAAHEQLKQQ